MKIIDTFKDQNFYTQLALNVNPKIFSILDRRFNFLSHDVKGKIKLIDWFKPDLLPHNPQPRPFENDLKFKMSSKFVLQDHFPGYIFIFLMDLLYSDRKDVLIEDVCCGIGRTELYLKHLGFNNFHMVDDFSQIRKESLETFMIEGQINYRLNEPNVNPDISYISGYPTFPKEVNDSIEFFCHYSNPAITKQLCESGLLASKGFIHLCTDVDNFMLAWCKQDKFEKFDKLIQPFVVG